MLLFSSCSEWGLLSSRRERASHCSGFSFYKAQALEHVGFSSGDSQDYVNHGNWIHSSLSKDTVGQFNWIWIKNKILKMLSFPLRHWATDALWLQMLTTCSSLRKPWETKGTDKNVCTQSPSCGALPPLWSWTKNLFIHSTGIMRDHNNFLSPTGSNQIVTLTGFLTIWSGQQLVCG